MQDSNIKTPLTIATKIPAGIEGAAFSAQKGRVQEAAQAIGSSTIIARSDEQEDLLAFVSKIRNKHSGVVSKFYEVNPSKEIVAKLFAESDMRDFGTDFLRRALRIIAEKNIEELPDGSTVEGIPKADIRATVSPATHPIDELNTGIQPAYENALMRPYQGAQPPPPMFNEQYYGSPMAYWSNPMPMPNYPPYVQDQCMIPAFQPVDHNGNMIYGPLIASNQPPLCHPAAHASAQTPPRVPIQPYSGGQAKPHGSPASSHERAPSDEEKELLNKINPGYQSSESNPFNTPIEVEVQRQGPPILVLGGPAVASHVNHTTGGIEDPEDPPYWDRPCYRRPRGMSLCRRAVSLGSKFDEKFLPLHKLRDDHLDVDKFVPKQHRAATLAAVPAIPSHNEREDGIRDHNSIFHEQDKKSNPPKQQTDDARLLLQEDVDRKMERMSFRKGHNPTQTPAQVQSQARALTQLQPRAQDHGTMYFPAQYDSKFPVDQKNTHNFPPVQDQKRNTRRDTRTYREIMPERLYIVGRDLTQSIFESLLVGIDGSIDASSQKVSTRRFDHTTKMVSQGHPHAWVTFGTAEQAKEAMSQISQRIVSTPWQIEVKFAFKGRKEESASDMKRRQHLRSDDTQILQNESPPAASHWASQPQWPSGLAAVELQNNHRRQQQERHTDALNMQMQPTQPIQPTQQMFSPVLSQGPGLNLARGLQMNQPYMIHHPGSPGDLSHMKPLSDPPTGIPPFDWQLQPPPDMSGPHLLGDSYSGMPRSREQYVHAPQEPVEHANAALSETTETLANGEDIAERPNKDTEGRQQRQAISEGSSQKDTPCERYVQPPATSSDPKAQDQQETTSTQSPKDGLEKHRISIHEIYNSQDVKPAVPEISHINARSLRVRKRPKPGELESAFEQPTEIPRGRKEQRESGTVPEFEKRTVSPAILALSTDLSPRSRRSSLTQFIRERTSQRRSSSSVTAKDTAMRSRVHSREPSNGTDTGTETQSSIRSNYDDSNISKSSPGLDSGASRATSYATALDEPPDRGFESPPTIRSPKFFTPKESSFPEEIQSPKEVKKLAMDGADDSSGGEELSLERYSEPTVDSKEPQTSKVLREPASKATAPSSNKKNKKKDKIKKKGKDKSHEETPNSILKFGSVEFIDTKFEFEFSASSPEGSSPASPEPSEATVGSQKSAEKLAKEKAKEKERKKKQEKRRKEKKRDNMAAETLLLFSKAARDS